MPRTRPEEVSNTAKLNRSRGPGRMWLSPKGCPPISLLNLFTNLESYLLRGTADRWEKLSCQELCLPSLWKTYKPSRCVTLPGDARLGKGVEIVAATAGAALVYGGGTCSACSSGLPGSCALRQQSTEQAGT